MSFLLVMGQGPYVGASLLNHPDVASPHRHLVVFLCSSLTLVSPPPLSFSLLFSNCCCFLILFAAPPGVLLFGKPFAWLVEHQGCPSYPGANWFQASLLSFDQSGGAFWRVAVN